MTRLIPAPESAPLHLERLPQVKRRCGLSRSAIYRGVAAGTFPAPVKLGDRASAWDSREVDAWIADKLAARDAARKAA